VTRRRAGAVLVAGAIVLLLANAGRAQTPAGDVLLPQGTFRPPVVLIVGPSEAAASLAEPLRASGVASLTETLDAANTLTPDARVRRIVDRLVPLRNDARFPTVIVIGCGSGAADAALAARLTRADGFVSVGRQDATAAIGRLIVPVLNAKSDPDGIVEIAQFAKRVPALGFRGGRGERSSMPRRSPRTVAIGSLAGTLAGIEYGQAQRRGRDIWGALVPWNRVWMPGADEATTLTTNTALRLGDVNLQAGDYTLYVDPREDRLQLLLSSDVGVFHTVYDSQKVIGRVDMTLTRRQERLEGMTFAIESRDDGGGALKLIWDDRDYGAPITVVR